LRTLLTFALNLVSPVKVVSPILSPAAAPALLNRYLARLRRPAAGHQRIMIRTLFAPGEIKLAIQRFVFVPVRGVTVDLRQTARTIG
jgi:hypothetical protein